MQYAENSRWSRVKVKVTIIIALLAMSIMSQNLIPVHIAFNCHPTIVKSV